MNYRHIAIVLIAFAGAAQAQAQTGPVGTWRTVDEKTGEPKSQVVITEQAGALAGRVAQVLRKDADPAARCIECTDDRKDKPIVGLDIICGGQKAADKAVWEGGQILDPENGKEYRASFTPIDGGARMEVRGYLGPFWRTQVWQRVP
ncbi:DUF2147 domain-containing protein [Xylophilus ampelinus]|uniref:Uncharacterized protein (DUF2147 family) n=1 Tax=Xylophilus ampelinus TaxID=54067 RepID=A0A318SFI7_9BURK|nr:DUF2147 domain-containing protein [Xylophilus ampelinus]MCS4510999.1 DUF2147 domain-containing protein [Xylophilus ampelinus]PYE76008.1 uncharacterized protein (DUF2147 family) [Xylophilus ampelinus]